MKNLIIWLKNLLGVSYHEARGYVILFIVLIIATFIPILQKQYYLSQTPPVDSNNIDSVRTLMEKSYEDTEDSTRSDDLFVFNPNFSTFDQLTTLGLDTAIARRLINYRNAGGEFRIRSDLLKIYGLPEAWYKNVHDSIALPDSIPTQVTQAPGRKGDDEESFADAHEGLKKNDSVAGLKVILNEPITKFDLNKADTAQLKKIYGIGSVLSGRIVRFRDKLGGFVSFRQLYEVYGLPEEVADELALRSYISENYQPEKIDVNSCSLQDLGNHPYLNYRMARAIIAYRNQHDGIADHNEFATIHLVPDSVKLKIEPYLSFR